MSDGETELQDRVFPDPDRYLQQAKQLVMENYNGHHEDENEPPLRIGDLHIVSFVKTLSTWRAQVGSGVVRGLVWIVTFNGQKNEAYIEVYRKLTNTKVSLRKGTSQTDRWSE
jgi:hypothetical protein